MSGLLFSVQLLAYLWLALNLPFMLFVSWFWSLDLFNREKGKKISEILTFNDSWLILFFPTRVIALVLDLMTSIRKYLVIGLTLSLILFFLFLSYYVVVNLSWKWWDYLAVVAVFVIAGVVVKDFRNVRFVRGGE